MWWLIGAYAVGSLVAIGIAGKWIDEDGLEDANPAWVYFWAAIAWLPFLLIALGARLAKKF